MTTEQEHHLETIQQASAHAIETKYRTGQAEHGGNLFDMSLERLLQEALDENTDQRVYIITAMQQLKQFMDQPIIRKAKDHIDHTVNMVVDK